MKNQTIRRRNTISMVCSEWQVRKGRDRIRSAKAIREVSNGSVSGIPALLLNEGLILNFDVIVLLGKLLKRLQNMDLPHLFRKPS